MDSAGTKYEDGTRGVDTTQRNLAALSVGHSVAIFAGLFIKPRPRVVDDYRVRVGFLDHPKTLRIKRRLGPGSVEILLRLFEFCTTSPSRRDGNLHGMDQEAIADALRYEGDPSVLVQALREVGWLDGRGKSLSIHDWAEINPYVANWKQRSASAQHAARIRWASGDHAARMRNQEKRNAPSPDPNPSPDPIPKPGVKPVSVSSGEEVDPRVADVVHMYLNRYSDRSAQCMKPDARTLIRARLAEGYTIELMGQAIDGNRMDEWHVSRGLTQIKHVFKDSDTVDKWVAVYAGGGTNNGNEGAAAWEEVKRKASNADTAKHSDPAAQAAVAKLGGWRRFGQSTSQQLRTLRAEFLDAYSVARREQTG